MSKFKVMIEDLTVYSCTVEAEDMDEAQEKFHEELEQNDYNYYETCKVFADMREEDGSIEEMWYDDDEPSRMTDMMKLENLDD